MVVDAEKRADVASYVYTQCAILYYTETLILLLLLISLFPRCYFLIKEPNNQFTYYMSLESFKLLFKIFNATFSWVFNP